MGLSFCQMVKSCGVKSSEYRGCGSIVNLRDAIVCWLMVGMGQASPCSTNTFCAHFSPYSHWIFCQRLDTVLTTLFIVVTKGSHSTIRLPFFYQEAGHILVSREECLKFLGPRTSLMLLLHGLSYIFRETMTHFLGPARQRNQQGAPCEFWAACGLFTCISICAGITSWVT